MIYWIRICWYISPTCNVQKIIGLCPRLDEDGVIRLNTRLQYAEFLPYDVRHPIVLLRKHWVTKLIVK